MRILRFDSVGGASGDMILGGLIKLGVDKDIIMQQLKTVIPDDFFNIELVEIVENGIAGVRAKVVLASNKDINADHHHEHEHGHSHNHHHAPQRTYSDIEKMIVESALSDSVKSIACKIFKNLAVAEGVVHGKDYKDVHFHEVGATDSIVDIVGIAVAYDMLNIDKIMVSPLPLGQGTIKCEHGLMPIPAPATAELLKNSQCIFTDEPFELVTPTGAAVLMSLSKLEREKTNSSQNIQNTVNSFGHRTLNSRINMLRIMLIDDCLESENGETEYNIDYVYKLSCNIDDMTPEHLGHVQDKLLSYGALDVYCENILMKKQRLAITLTVLCDQGNKEHFIEYIFHETTSLGIRIELIQRAVLRREFVSKKTKLGSLNLKQSFFNNELITKKIEFNDLEKMASEQGVTIKELILKLNDLLG